MTSLGDKLYAVLGVARDATEAQIKRAYRRLAKHLHPDVPGGGNAEKFAEATHAYDVLSDPARRTYYDATGDDIPKPKPDETQAKAQDLIRDLIGHILRDADDDIASAPIISLMRDHLKKTQKELDARIKQAQGIKARAEKIADRFKRKGDKDNVLGALVRGHIELAQKAIENNEAAKPILQRAIDIVADHTFEVERLLADTAFGAPAYAATGQLFGFSSLLGGSR